MPGGFKPESFEEVRALLGKKIIIQKVGGYLSMDNLTVTVVALGCFPHIHYDLHHPEGYESELHWSVIVQFREGETPNPHGTRCRDEFDRFAICVLKFNAKGGDHPHWYSQFDLEPVFVIA